MNDDQLRSFLDETAEIAAAARSLNEQQEAEADKARNAKADASDAVAKLKQAAAGFTAPRFAGLARVGSALAQRTNDLDSDAARDWAMKAAVGFMVGFTGATAKTIEGGGTKNGFAAFIRLGADAGMLATKLQDRVNYWQDRFDSEPTGESGDQKKERRNIARRYLTPADSGRPAVEAANGKPAKPAKPAKFLGRPEVNIGDINIPAGKGTSRNSQIAQAAALYAVHGNDFLKPDVLDAFLDNGGLREPEEETVSDIAKRLGDETAALLAKAADSPDAVMLRSMCDFLDSLRDRGVFTPSRAAEAMQQEIPGVPLAPGQDVSAPKAVNAKPAVARKAKGGVKL